MIKASDVKKLREETSAPMMKVKEALVESQGDFDKAKQFLQKKGEEVLEKKSQRKANEGVLGCYVHSNGKVAALAKLTCETDFVAKNEAFKKLAHDIAMQVAAMSPKYISFETVPDEDMDENRKTFEAQVAKEKKPADIKKKIVEGKIRKLLEEKCLLSQPFIKDDKKTISDLITAGVAKFGENIKVKDFIRYEL